MKTTAKMIATCSGLKFLITFIVVIASSISSSRTTCVASPVYFPLSSIQIQLPVSEKSQSIFSNIPVGYFPVLSTRNNSIAPNYVYSLENDGNGYLTINSSSGEVFATEKFVDLNSTITNFTISAQNRDAVNSTKVPHMSLQLTAISNDEFCKNLENICFWPAAHYTITEHSGYEQFRPIRVGALNSRGAQYLCPHKDITYKLLEGTTFFTIKENTLYTKRAIDHEQLNSTESGGLMGSISCRVTLGNNDVREFRRSLTVNVIDRNDNGPVLQDNKTYNFVLEDPHFRVNDSIGEKIIFIDNDTMETNAHLLYQIHNDSYDLLRPLCNAYETDHTGRRNSIISCQIIFTRNGILSVSPYCVSLEAWDRTVDGNRKKSATAEICINTDLQKIHEADRPRALALRGGRQNRKYPRIIDSDESILSNEEPQYGLIFTQSITSIYPKDVDVFRSATVYNRVTQPENFRELLLLPALRFGIAEDRSGAFGITSKAGIIYVKSASALQNAVETVYFLNVTWHDTHARSFVINVHLVEGRPANTTCDHKEKSRSQTCAQVKYKRQCEHFCGLATNGGACEWRGSIFASFTRNYASCVPNAQYCPDNICDPLEELETFACPQDCTMAHKIMGPHSVNDNKRGILSASGTCICEDNGKCSCAPLDEEPRPKRKRKNETASAKLEEIKKVEEPPAGMVCGTSCMIIGATCPLVFIVLLLLLLITRRKVQRNAEEKEEAQGSTQKQCNDSNDHGECSESKGDLPLMPLENGFKFAGADSKWEFDPKFLRLDTILGEGEFGKVMKGYATNILGIPGVTTVAVKMLKNGANSVEYMALLSEFQLLQEVSHPNVIKLLGACTQGDTPMVIIEYARYGSLRSYLRLSRKIECAGVDFTDGVEPVTAKNILSMAWQICKGMAYLTEIKLVHRDLAARNVLLADGKICKVSDFGLTRDIYEDDAYLKRSRDRVPVKWMAPESLADQVYTIKSDVWAFGVLCWELITLGASPYPGVPPQSLYHLLRTGYRMECPENCSEEIYSIVRTCWAEDPNTRPSFKFLASEFEKLLGNNAKYIELESHAVSNPLYCSDETKLLGSTSQSNLDKIMENVQQQQQLTCDLGTPDCLDHLWRPPKMGYETNDCLNSRELSLNFSSDFQPPPGYDMPRPLIETSTTEQVLRYQNDLRFPLNIRKSVCSSQSGSPNYAIKDHYSVPVKRGRSYMDMCNKLLLPDNLDSKDFEKHISKNISFRFSSLLNLSEQEDGGVV